MTMKLRAMVMSNSALLGVTLPARALKQGLICFILYIVPLGSVCSSQHGLKQIKLFLNSRSGCETALRSEGRLCLQ